MILSIRQTNLPICISSLANFLTCRTSPSSWLSEQAFFNVLKSWACRVLEERACLTSSTPRCQSQPKCSGWCQPSSALWHWPTHPWGFLYFLHLLGHCLHCSSHSERFTSENCRNRMQLEPRSTGQYLTSVAFKKCACGTVVDCIDVGF